MPKWWDDLKGKLEDAFRKPKLTKDQILVKTDVGLPAKGNIAAFGHFTADRGLDVFIISEDRKQVLVYTWNQKEKKYEKNEALIKIEADIVNVVPSDFNHDGFLDVLVVSKSKKGGSFANQLFYGDGVKSLKDSRIALPDTKSEPIIFDFEGKLKSDLLGVISDSADNQLTVMHSFTANTFKQDHFGSFKCALSPDHWSAYADISGDGRSDLLLHCGGNKLVIIRNTETGYVQGSELDLPADATQLTVADVDGDGALDLVFTTKDTLHILYNKQRPFCTGNKDDPKDCKNFSLHFEEDTSYGFELNSKYHQQINLGFTIGDNDGFGPVPLSVGDFDLDGFPDLLVPVSVGTKSRVALLHNIPHSSKKNPRHTRTFTETFQDVENFSKVTGLSRAVFADLGGNGDLSIMAQSPDIALFKNDGYADAFFVRAECLNGVCPYPCMNEKTDAPGATDPYGVNYSGANFKLSFTDMNGSVRVRTAAQLAQTGNRACQMPFVVMGLGRTNSFIDLFSTASSLNHASSHGSQAHIIPNSDLIVSPPHADSAGQWGYQIHIHPAAHMPWVAVTLALALVLLSSLTGFFKLKERREDEEERRKQAHAINFDAM